MNPSVGYSTPTYGGGLKTTLLLALLALTAGCFVDVSLPQHFDAETARELAPDLTEIEAAFPEAHRVLSDGTWDSLDFDEKLEFTRKLAVDAEELVQRQRLENAANERRGMLEWGVDEDSVDMVLTRSELWELGGIERNLRREMNPMTGKVYRDRSER